MRRSLLPAVLIATCGCRAPKPPKPELPPMQVTLPVLDHGCKGTVPGWLTALDGQLVFWPDDASFGSDMVKPLGPPYWNAQTILLPRGTDEWFSTLLPGHAGKLISVRTTYGEQHVEGRDELVEIDRRTLATRVLWAPGHRLLLLGRTGARVMLLDYDGSVARVVGFDLETQTTLHSEPVDLDLDELTIRPETLYRSWRLDPNDGGNEWSGCHGPADYVLQCRNDRLCRARIEGSTITIEFVDLEPCPEPTQTDEGLVEQGPWMEPGTIAQRLPVDGQMIHGVRVEVDACRVRSNLYFPTRTDAPDEPCRVEVVEKPDPESMPWFREVIVGPGCTLSTGFAEHAFALPPERVTIMPLHEHGAWRVRLPYPDSSWADADCLQGDLWLRAIDWQAFSRIEHWLGWEYGFCE